MYDYLVLSVPTIVRTNNNNKRKRLPDHVVIGYADNFDSKDKILQAVKDGVNVIVWAFFNFDENTGKINQPRASKAVSLIEHEIPKDVIHLTSFGGWNGPHLLSRTPEKNYYSAQQLYDAWVEFNQNHQEAFDGFDWDLEGNDNPQAKTAVFTYDCLQKVVEMSRLAKCDEYIVGMAPPQSYLDIQSDFSTISPYFNNNHNNNEQRHVKNNKNVAPFSTRLNFPPTLISPLWHPEFHYTSHNSYAYLLAHHSEAFDFISIQFYETWSRANYEINQHDKNSIDPSDYLVRYVKDLLFRQEGYHVSFPNEILLPTTKNAHHMHINVQLQDIENIEKNWELGDETTVFISLPMHKLVFGFANGWALDRKDGGAVFFQPSDIQKAFDVLRQDADIVKNKHSLPRGCMFWCIDHEGDHGIYMAKGLN